MKKKRLRVFFDRGPMTASVSVVFNGMLKGDRCVRLQYLLVGTGRIRNISGWPIREVHVPYSVYNALLRAMKSVGLSLKASEIAIDSSEDGNAIVLYVCFCQSSLLFEVNRKFGVCRKKRVVFFPFNKRQGVTGVRKE